MLPGTCLRALAGCVVCALSGLAAPGGRCRLAPVRVPWLWPAVWLSGVPPGPAWCTAPRPVRSLLVPRSAFRTPWCLSPPQVLLPPDGLDGCAGHAEAVQEPGSLCLPLAPAEVGSLGSLRVVPVGGPAMGLSLAGLSSVGLGLRALRWFGVWTRSLTRPVSRTVRRSMRDSVGAPGLFCVGAATSPCGSEDATPGSRVCVHVRALLGRVGRAGLPGALGCASPFLWPRCPFALLATLQAGVALCLAFCLPPPLVLLSFFFFFLPLSAPPSRLLSLASGPRCAGPWRCVCPPFFSFLCCFVSYFFLFVSCFSLRPAWFGVCFLPPVLFLFPPLPLFLFPFFCSFFCLSPRLVRFVGLPLLFSRCAPLAAPLRLLPLPRPLVGVSRFPLLPLDVPWFSSAALLLPHCLAFVSGSRRLLPAPALVRALCLVLSLVAARAALPSGVLHALLPVLCCVLCCGASPCCVVGCCAVFFGAFFFLFFLCYAVLLAACCAMSLVVSSCCVVGVVVCCLVLVCGAACCAVLCPWTRCCAAALRVSLPGVVLFCAVLCCVAPLMPFFAVLCPRALSVALGSCADQRCVLLGSPALCALCCVCFAVVCWYLLLVAAVLCAACACCVCPGVTCCAFPVLYALCGAVLCCAGALVLCCSCGLRCLWWLVLWCVAVCF